MPDRPRRRCANAPRNCPTPPTGARPPRRSATCWRSGRPRAAPAKDVDDALWQRFKAAQDTFFAARNAVTAERDAEFRANADAKEALLAEAEQLDTSDLDAARAALRTIGDKWDTIGKVPRERSADLERRLRAVEKKVRDAPTRRRRSGGAGARRPVPRARRTVRTAGREGRRRPAAPRTPRRPGPAPSSGGSGRRRRPKRSVRRASLDLSWLSR